MSNHSAVELNPRHAQAIMELVNATPLATALEMSMTAMTYGRVEGTLEVSKMHHNAFGGIHGGMFATFIDHLAYFALYTMLDEGMGATSLDLHTDYLRSCTQGTLTGIAQVMKKGGQISLVEVDIYDQEGRAMAHGTSKMLSSPTLQSAKELIATTRPGFQLPEKFL